MDSTEQNKLPPERLSSRVRQQRPGYSLDGDFYFAEEIYHWDLRRIWRRGWLFAAHACELPEPGDYITLEVGDDSLLVIRDEEAAVRAFHNVCRHRGSLLCPEPAGRVPRLVCPYHQWTYDHQGRLLASRGMPEEVKSSDLNLHAVAAREVAGLIFICLATEPPDFSRAAEALESLAAPQGLRQAVVARTLDYEVRANWKLVWENNRECYHCNVNHPQYIKANFDHYNADDTSDRVRADLGRALERSERAWAAQGLATTHRETGMTVFPDAERDLWFSANRTPLAEGYVSETMDGRMVAPLMGAYQEPGVGTLRMRTLPNFWNHSSCDHAVSTRLLPGGPERTRVRVTWLVAGGAVEGRDYDLEKVLPFWKLTSEQDWTICERQQRGVKSSAYQPGPYSPFKEYNVDRFVRWYLQKLAPTI
jgi:glycine betaine monooxygenase A